jgi:coenzyme PQQ synthesis protein D (PqqD)
MRPTEIEPVRLPCASQSAFRISNTVRSTSTADGCVLLDIHHGRILGLNVVASLVFDMLRRGLDQNQIADEISRKFDVSVNDVRADVFQLIETLQKYNILQPIRPDGAFAESTGD